MTRLTEWQVGDLVDDINERISERLALELFTVKHLAVMNIMGQSPDPFVSMEVVVEK